MPLNPNHLQALNAAVLSDTLDSLGLMQQAMKPFMRPLDDSAAAHRPRAHRPVHAGVRAAGRGREPLRGGDRAGRRPRARRRGGAGLRRPDRAHRALGRVAVDGQRGARRGRLRHRRPGARRQADPRDALPGVLRRHRAARHQGPRAHGRARRAGGVRRRRRAPRRPRVRRRRRRGRHPARASSRRSCAAHSKRSRARTSRARRCSAARSWPTCSSGWGSCSRGPRPRCGTAAQVHPRRRGRGNPWLHRPLSLSRRPACAWGPPRHRTPRRGCRGGPMPPHAG